MESRVRTPFGIENPYYSEIAVSATIKYKPTQDFSKHKTTWAVGDTANVTIDFSGLENGDQIEHVFKNSSGGSRTITIPAGTHLTSGSIAKEFYAARVITLADGLDLVVFITHDGEKVRVTFDNTEAQ